MHKATFNLLAAGLAFASAASLAAFAQTSRPSAHASPQSGAGVQASSFGDWSLTADSFHFDGNAAVYTTAHMVSQNGTTLDADTVRIDLDSATNGLQNIVATGHVKSYFVQPPAPTATPTAKPQPPRTITVTSDKAVYDPATRKINLTGNVRTAISSKFTTGPFIQTGDTGVITLGATPDDTQITMNNVHATFTPDSAIAQTPPKPAAAKPSAVKTH